MNNVVNEIVAKKYLNDIFASVRKILQNNFEEISVEFTSYKEDWKDKYIVRLKSSTEKNNFIEIDLSKIEINLYEELLKHCITFYKETNSNNDWNTFIFVSTKNGEWSCEYNFVDETNPIKEDTVHDDSVNNKENFIEATNFETSVEEKFEKLNNMYDPLLSSSMTYFEEQELPTIESNDQSIPDEIASQENMSYEFENENIFPILEETDTEQIKTDSVSEAKEEVLISNEEYSTPSSENEVTPDKILNNLYVSKNIKLFDLLLGLYKGESVPSKIVFENQEYVFYTNDYIKNGDLLANQSLILSLHSMEDLDKEIQIL